MGKTIFQYKIEIDFIKNEKTKTVYEHKQLAETEEQIAYLNLSWARNQHISVLNKVKEKYQSDAALNDYDTSRFHLSDYKDEYSAYVYLDEKPKSDKAVFNKLQKLLNKRLYKDHSRYLMGGEIKFDDIETTIKKAEANIEQAAA